MGRLVEKEKKMIWIILIIISGVIGTCLIFKDKEKELSMLLAPPMSIFLLLVFTSVSYGIDSVLPQPDFSTYTIGQLENIKTRETKISDIDRLEVNMKEDNGTCVVVYSSGSVNNEISTDSHHVSIQKSETGEKSIIKYKVKERISTLKFLFVLPTSQEETVYVIYD